MKLIACELPNGFSLHDQEYLKSHLTRIHTKPDDILVTHEMPFGNWFADEPEYNSTTFEQSVALHEEGMGFLANLDLNVVTSAPQKTSENVNSALVITNGEILSPHTKQYFPQEAGFYEQSWFNKGTKAFELADIKSIKLGILLCTDAMYLEHARHYSQAGASIIAVPRATSGGCDILWETMLKAMAMNSGCYIVSSNRVTLEGSNLNSHRQTFNGRGMIINPEGVIIAVTSREYPLVAVEYDHDLVKKAKQQYPVYLQG